METGCCCDNINTWPTIISSGGIFLQNYEAFDSEVLESLDILFVSNF